MKMADKRPLNDLELDGLFSAARDAAPVPSEDLMARILADAEARIAAVETPDAPRRGVFAGVLGLIGGWPAAAGLVTATMAGLAIGLVTPETLDDLTGGYLASATAYELEDLMPSYGDILGEG